MRVCYTARLSFCGCAVVLWSYFANTTVLLLQKRRLNEVEPLGLLLARCGHNADDAILVVGGVVGEVPTYFVLGGGVHDVSHIRRVCVRVTGVVFHLEGEYMVGY